MGRNEKISLLTLLLIALISAGISGRSWYTAHTKLAPALGGNYQEGMIGQPRTINPLLATTATDSALVHLVYSGLYKYDGNGNIIPDLADGMPTISEDQKEYTVHIKKDAQWHDGQTVTASDIVFTINTLQDANYKSPERSAWTNTSVDRIDDITVVFKNKDISGPFINNLTLPILPEHIWSQVTSDNFASSSANIEAVGSGPYAIKDIKRQPSGKLQSIRLDSFSNFYFGKPNINSITAQFYDTNEDVINALHAKEISGFGTIAFDKNSFVETGSSNLNLVTAPLPQYQAIFFNVTTKPFTDKAVRQALSLATNKQAILDEILGGKGKVLNGPIPAQQLGFADTPSTYNVEAAKDMLDKAGWKVDPTTNIRTKSKVPLDITILTNDFLPNTKTADMLVQQWGALNIKVKFSTIASKDLTENVIRNRQFSVLLFSQKLGADPDPFAFWHSSQAKNPGLNITGFANAQADKLISEARGTTNKDTRTADYQKFQQLIVDEAPAIFLNENVYLYAINSQIKNVTINVLFDPAYRFYDVTNWYIQQKRVWK